jgi:hypothetical protein
MESKVASSASTLPYFDRSSLTRVLCIIGFTFSWLFALSCLGVGIASTQHIWQFDLSKDIYPELIVLAQNVVITICNESLGFIHSSSLRWALQSEGRLVFNSNVRLLSSARKHGPNKWYSNILVMCGIIAAYASSALTFLEFSDGDDYAFQVNGPAFVTLGCGMAAQASIATWAMFGRSALPTWSSNFMDTAAACLSASRGLKHRLGRCMQGVHLALSPAEPSYPQRRQPSAYQAHKEIRQVLWLLWTFPLLGCIWAIALIFASGRAQQFVPCSWAFDRESCTPSATLTWADVLDEGNLPSAVFAWVFFLICAIQATITLTLHCAELHVNCSRDEATWRKASSAKGLKRTSNALLSLLSSWQGVSLFCFKPFVHWLYSLTFFIDLTNGISFNGAQVLYLTASMALLAVFSSVLMFWRYKGPQPATFGHLQSLVDLIDEWPEKKDRVFWGAKGEEGEVAHAGTSWMPLEAVRFDEVYA